MSTGFKAQLLSSNVLCVAAHKLNSFRNRALCKATHKPCSLQAITATSDIRHLLHTSEATSLRSLIMPCYYEISDANWAIPNSNM